MNVIEVEGKSYEVLPEGGLREIEIGTMDEMLEEAARKDAEDARIQEQAYQRLLEKHRRRVAILRRSGRLFSSPSPNPDP